MIIQDRNGETQEINKGDKIIITLYDWRTNKHITTMHPTAYEPHEVIEHGGRLGVIWGFRDEFTPLTSFIATFERVDI